jgi:hypothetical protein
MGLSRPSQFDAVTTNQPNGARSALACVVAPEDVAVGDFIALLNEVAEVPSFYWPCADWRLPHDQPVRIRFMPREAGLPLKVKSLCLPFVLVKHPAGEMRTLDVRQCQLARLDRKYAVAARKACKKSLAQSTSRG